MFTSPPQTKLPYSLARFPTLTSQLVFSHHSCLLPTHSPKGGHSELLKTNQILSFLYLETCTNSPTNPQSLSGVPILHIHLYVSLQRTGACSVPTSLRCSHTASLCFLESPCTTCLLAFAQVVPTACKAPFASLHSSYLLYLLLILQISAQKRCRSSPTLYTLGAPCTSPFYPLSPFVAVSISPVSLPH